MVDASGSPEALLWSAAFILIKRRKQRSDASCDCRCGRDRRQHRLFPHAPRREADRRRADRRRARRLRQVGRVSGARLVRRHAASGARAAEFCTPREPRLRARRGLGFSPYGHLRRFRECAERVERTDEAPALPWLSKGVAINQRLGTGATTAQVHPGAFTKAMMRAAEARGAELRLGAVTGIFARTDACAASRSTAKRCRPMRSSSPWGHGRSSRRAGCRSRAFLGLRATASCSTPATAVPAEALFLEYQEQSGAMLTPEVFPRTDGTTYICAISSESPVPADPADVTPDPGALERLESLATKLSPELRSRENSRAAGVLSAGHAGWPAADRKSAGRRRRLRRDRPQRVGHFECAGDRRGDGGADRRRRGEDCRSFAVRSGRLGIVSPAIIPAASS